MPGFQRFLSGFLHLFVLSQLATSSTRVSISAVCTGLLEIHRCSVGPRIVIMGFKAKPIHNIRIRGKSL